MIFNFKSDKFYSFKTYRFIFLYLLYTIPNMNLFAETPKPPYYAVIFTSERTEEMEGYSDTSERMINLAQQQEGFLGVESARENLGITVSYWRDLESIKKWKMNTEHLIAQNNGKAIWYKNYKTRICLVERDYEFK